MHLPIIYGLFTCPCQQHESIRTYMGHEDFSRGRSRYILAAARSLAKRYPLTEYLRLSVQFLTTHLDTYQPRVCHTAEPKWERVLKNPVLPGGNIVDKRTGIPLARIQKSSIRGLKPWLPDSPVETHGYVAVKNPTGDLDTLTYPGERNVLLEKKGYMFIGKLLGPDRVGVARPVRGNKQESLLELFEKAIERFINK